MTYAFHERVMNEQASQWRSVSVESVKSCNFCFLIVRTNAWWTLRNTDQPNDQDEDLEQAKRRTPDLLPRNTRCPHPDVKENQKNINNVKFANAKALQNIIVHSHCFLFIFQIFEMPSLFNLNLLWLICVFFNEGKIK